jgi:crotonobetainyl-CoA:carnitine CoA-transferase CaiB-like acyl-CoA transferase
MAAAVPISDGGEIRLVGPAMRLSRTPSRMNRAIGSAGEHNEEIFREIGFADEEIAALRSDNVI